MVRNKTTPNKFKMKGLNWFVYTKINNWQNETERDNRMAEKENNKI